MGYFYWKAFFLVFIESELPDPAFSKSIEGGGGDLLWVEVEFSGKSRKKSERYCRVVIDAANSLSYCVFPPACGSFYGDQTPIEV